LRKARDKSIIPFKDFLHTLTCFLTWYSLQRLSSHFNMFLSVVMELGLPYYGNNTDIQYLRAGCCGVYLDKIRTVTAGWKILHN